jgi:hypothetical protein
VEDTIENDILFDNCSLFGNGRTREEILKDINTDEAKLILGYIAVENENYEQAKNIFETFYGEGNALFLADVGYCLGVMYYYGKGYPTDKVKGWEMIKESRDIGYFYAYQAFPWQKKDVFSPVNDTITRYTGNNCGKIAR